MSDLVTLNTVKSYIGNLSGNSADSTLQGLIHRASGYIQKVCSRQFPRMTFTDFKFSGTGSNRVVLPGTPILSVSALQIGNVVVSPSSDGMTQPGYAFDDLCLYLLPGANCAYFPMGFNNIKASWESGYLASQTEDIPTGNTPTLYPSNEGWAAENSGVVYAANSAAMTSVTANPGAGQYVFNGSTGGYTFNSTENGVGVRMTYYAVPSAIEQAALEMVVGKYKTKDNLGVRSKTLAQETVTYEERDMSPAVRAMLVPYIRRSFT